VNRGFKAILLVIMVTALGAGFMHHLIPPKVLNFERLHIFLFNLCSGGTTLIAFTEDRPSLSRQTLLFLLLSLLFTICAFMQWYAPTLVLPLLLALIVEKVRVAHFGSFWPWGLFTARESVSRKFHQAALCCLSLGLLQSALVVLNNVYMHWLTLEKLKLDTFFLGFSFPLSLISMSIIFALMKKDVSQRTTVLEESTFWIINLGVIIFFLFILARLFLPQVGIAAILFATVGLVLRLYWHQGIRLQQKSFLTSGILFLLITSITGIIYILLAFSKNYDPQQALPLLRLHAFTALYGWNLSGLVVIIRRRDFPIRLHSEKVILLHWLTVLILCPLGYYYPLAAVLAVFAYLRLLQILFFNDGQVDSGFISAENSALKV
jgi:hypothetical protein